MRISKAEAETYHIQLNHYGYDLRELQAMDSVDLYVNVDEAAEKISEWFHSHRVAISKKTIRSKLLALVYGGEI